MADIRFCDHYEINFKEETVRLPVGTYHGEKEYHYYVSPELFDDAKSVCQLFELAFNAGSKANADDIKRILNIRN